MRKQAILQGTGISYHQPADNPFDLGVASHGLNIFDNLDAAGFVGNNNVALQGVDIEILYARGYRERGRLF
jgi:hypothetical protein